MQLSRRLATWNVLNPFSLVGSSCLLLSTVSRDSYSGSFGRWDLLAFVRIDLGLVNMLAQVDRVTNTKLLYGLKANLGETVGRVFPGAKSG